MSTLSVSTLSDNYLSGAEKRKLESCRSNGDSGCIAKLNALDASREVKVDEISKKILSDIDLGKIAENTAQDFFDGLEKYEGLSFSDAVVK